MPAKAKVVVTEIQAKNLKFGDLFSISPQKYWDRVMNHGNIVGEPVYVRTNVPFNIIDNIDLMIYKITISQEE